MKLSSFFKTKPLILFLFFSMAMVSQESCKKADLQPEVTTETQDVNSAAVLSFLAHSQTGATSQRIDFINKIKQNLILDKLYTEKLHEDETLFVVL